MFSGFGSESFESPPPPLFADVAGSESPPLLQTESGTNSIDYYTALEQDYRRLFGRTPTSAECRGFSVCDDSTPDEAVV